MYNRADTIIIIIIIIIIWHVSIVSKSILLTYLLTYLPSSQVFILLSVILR